MRAKNIGLAAATVTIAIGTAIGTAACGSSGGKASAASPAATATTATSTARHAGPFTADKLQAALLNAAVWGSGWTDVKDGPLVTTSGLGTVDQIPSQDCWKAVYSGTRVGSLTAVEDVVDSGSGIGDIAHQSLYQFGPGTAATMMTDTAAKVSDCGTFKYTDDNKLAFTVQAQEAPVPGVGDQATRTVVLSVSAQAGEDEYVDLRVRYGDAVIDVGYDSAIATTALDYDLTGKAQAIAANLGLAAAAG